MNFERGKDPKEAMRVGVASKIVHPEKIIVKFKINKDDKTDLKPIDSSDFTEFLEMWQNQRFSSWKLVTMLNLRGFLMALTMVRVVGVNIKLRFVDPEKRGSFNFNGNFLETTMGNKKKVYVSWQGKIYVLPVKYSRKSFFI